ncbi:MAG: hypothetical protein K0Q95_546 [Bacteroidota bacterium]|jgi:hypothetical protein|nr:hypothetical protein [Bacteroidota bacterium]
MKMRLIPLLLILSWLSVNAQPNLSWAKRMGDTAEDEGADVTIDAVGNVYTTGCFRGIVDFDPGPGVYNLKSSGDHDIFITKFDASGNLIWARKMGGLAGDGGQSITVDDTGNVYTAGVFSGTGDFDPGPGMYYLTASAYDIFICKLDSSGNLIWAKNMGGPNSQTPYTVQLDSAGNIYTSGFFSGSADFDPGPAVYSFTSNGSGDIFISKLTNAGDFVWAKHLGSKDWDYGGRIALDQRSNLYIIGSFRDTMDLDPGISVFNAISHGQSDIFISKLDSSGNLVWAKTFGSYNDDVLGSIIADNSGNVYCTGSFGAATDFDPGTGNYTLSPMSWDEDIFISKLDSSGTFVWAKSFGGMAGDNGNDIALDSSGNVYTVGRFYYTADFDPGPGTYHISSGTGVTCYLNKLDPAGSNVWAIPYPDGAYFIESIAIDKSGNIYTTGSLLGTGTSDFDLGSGVYNLTCAGAFDVYVTKYNEELVTGTSEKFNNSGVISIYPNPTAGLFRLRMNGSTNKDVKIEIIDLAGKLMFATIRNIENNNVEIDASCLSNGIYFLKILNDGLSGTQKLIVNK